MIMTTTTTMIYSTTISSGIIMCNNNNCTNRNSSCKSSSSSSSAAAFGLRRSSSSGGGGGGGGVAQSTTSTRRRSNVVVSSSSSSSSSSDVDDDDGPSKQPLTTTMATSSNGGAGGIQVYRDIERLLMDTVKQSQGAFGASSDWTEVEGAWVLKPKNSKPVSVVHFVGGIFVGAAPQLTYRLFLERLAQKGVLVIATPYSSGFDHFLIADEVQFKFDRCRRSLQEPVQDLPTFGIGHSLGALIHLLIGSRYAVERKGNVLMAFNNKIKSYYGVSTNLLIKFKDDTIDETSALAYVLSDSAISSKLDMSIRYLPGDHGLPLQQALPDVPPAMADAVNRGGELLANLSIGTPWESVAKEMSNTLGGVDNKILRAEISKDLDMLVDVITSWMASNEGPKLLKS